jgi:hypothetical protein
MKQSLFTVFTILCCSAAFAQEKSNAYMQQRAYYPEQKTYARAQYPGTNIRGLVRAVNPYGRNYVSFPGAPVDLYAYYANSGWVKLAQTVTNQNGYYFFYRVQPGSYYLQVNYLKNYQVSVVQIDYRQYQFQDMSPLNYY